MSLLSTFATAVLPVVAVAAAGYLLGTVEEVDVGPLNTVTIYRRLRRMPQGLPPGVESDTR